MRVVVGLGANLGDRLASLRDAAARLSAYGEVLARSRIYETDFVGEGTQPHYLNAAISMTTTLEPLVFMRKLLAIEAAMGRVRTAGTRAPRTIDLDVLWIEGVTLDHETLVVPHPRLFERAFALGPLLEVEPNAFPNTKPPRETQPATLRFAVFDRSTLRAFGDF